jgi:hypothetical protein
MVGFIATCQAFVAISILLKGWIFKTGCIGAIIFFLPYAPLGVGAAFPCTVIMAWHYLFCLKNITTTLFGSETEIWRYVP